MTAAALPLAAHLQRLLASVDARHPTASTTEEDIMGDIAVTRREGERRVDPIESLGPLRVMRRLLTFEPFRDITPFIAPDETLRLAPPFEIRETKEAYEFCADLPGVSEEDVEISMTGNRLIISGKREAETSEASDTYFTTERTYGSFVRAFTLPDASDMDRVSASLADGVLSVTVPRKPEARPTRIEVKSAPAIDADPPESKS